MPRIKNVLITGVANQWGARLAATLCQRNDLHVIGIDTIQPATPIDGLDFIQADIRNPLLLDLLTLEKVHTVYHLAFQESYRRSESIFDHNVIGSMKFLGACAEAGVRKIIFKSSTRVYGATHRNPAFITENRPIHGSRQYGYNRDLVEIESFLNGYQRQYPKITLTILRFAHIIGPTANTPMVRFLSDKKAPILLGFDPMMQVIHESDVQRAFLHVLDEDYPGAYNIAAEGILPLTKILGIVGKIPLPVLHPFAYWSVSASLPLAYEHFPIEPDYLRYRCVVDLKLMHERLGFTPQYTAEEALREFAGQQRMRPYLSESPRAYDEERLRDTIERRRRARAVKGA